MTKTVLVVVAHTDDEVLGCGGTIARHVAEGDSVYAVFMADGVTSRAMADSNDLSIRNLAAEQAGKVLGINQSYFLGLPDNRLDSLPLLDIIKSLEAIIHKLQPSIVYTHHFGDLNVDHQVTHQAVMTACRATPASSVKEIFTFEVMSSTEWSSNTLKPFLPNLFINITDYKELKMKALEAYALEMRELPHSRSMGHIICLAQHRGNSVGIEAAEAFMIMRIIR